MLLACASWLGSSSAASYPRQYDRQIESAAGRWLPAYPSWKRGKAQLIAESNLNPTVCSAVGACGLAQFMPETWKEVARGRGQDESVLLRFNPDLAIEYWAQYQGRLYNNWRSPRPVEDRVSLSESSYNAGLGWILKAQSQCNNAALWADVMKCLPAITGEAHSRETIGYTTRIRKIWRELELGR